MLSLSVSDGFSNVRGVSMSGGVVNKLSIRVRQTQLYILVFWARSNGMMGHDKIKMSTRTNV